MFHETIGFVGGLLVLASGVSCCIKIVRGEHAINPATCFVWVTLGFAVLLPQLGFVSRAALWPSVFGCVLPIIAGLCMLCNQRERRPLESFEIIALAGGIITLVFCGLSYGMGWSGQYAVYMAIIADACATIPITLILCVCSDKDAPFPYVAFGLGYMLSMFAVTEYAVVNYAVPVYMVCISACAAAPLIRYRLRMKVPLRKWREWM